MGAPRRVSQARAVAEVAELARTRSGETAFVGVDGPGGAGKSTFARRLARAVTGAAVVSVDDFSGPGFDEWDWDRFAAQIVAPLLAGRTARYQLWDWSRDEGGPWHDVAAGTLVIVEGVSSTRREVALAWALRIWVETPRELRHARALERDGPQMTARWHERWIPSEEAYIAAQHPQERADLIVPGDE